MSEFLSNPKQELTVSTSPNNENLLMWEEVRTSGRHPSRRSYHSAVMWGDKMLIYGGQDLNEGPQGGLWSIQISQYGNENWEKINVEEKGSLSRHSAILKSNKMYIFGGTNGIVEFNRTLILDLLTLKFSEVLPPNNSPPPLDSHTASLYESKHDDYMVTFGGFTHGEKISDTFLLNLSTLIWQKIEVKGKTPEKRSDHSAVVHQESLFIFGGNSDDGEKLNDFWRLDLVSNEWELILAYGDVPTGRSGHSAVVYKSLMVVFGGVKDITKETNDMYSYNFDEKLWTLFQYEYQVKDPVSSNDLEEFKKSNAGFGIKIKNQSEIRSSRNSPRKKNETVKESVPRRTSIESARNWGKRRKTLYAGPSIPTHGRIRGKIPHPRDGHSAVINENLMIIFGGDRHQMPFNDTYVYSLDEESIKTPVSGH